jgi:CBS-domain-containing membrane protein
MATPRRVIGGHVVGVLIGLTGGILLHGLLDQPYETNTLIDVAASIGVGAGMLAMSVTDTEHPPAAGTILGLTMGERALASGVLVLSAALVLCVARALLSRWLMDLTGTPRQGE